MKKIYIQFDWHVKNEIRDEMREWIDENLSASPILDGFCDVYSFENKDDAAHFMLVWGIRILDEEEIEKVS